MCTDCQYHKDQSIQLAAAVEGFVLASEYFKTSRYTSSDAKKKMGVYKARMKQLALNIKKESEKCQQSIFDNK